MAGVAILRALHEHCNAAPPEPAQLAAWKEAFLERWEKEIGKLTDDAEFISRRRRVILDTFADFARVAEAFHKE